VRLREGEREREKERKREKEGGTREGERERVHDFQSIHTKKRFPQVLIWPSGIV
jgi:hypothetical protein